MMHQEESKAICAFPTKANPPHLGLVLELFQIADKYSKIYVLYYDDPTLMPTESCINVLKSIICKFTDKYVVLKSPFNMEKIEFLPDQLKELGITEIVTTSNKIYKNCAINHIPVRRLTRAKGYHDVQQQIAYSHGFLLDSLNEKFKGR